MATRRWLPAAGFAALWIVAAAFTPDVTYHLAPVIVAGAPAVVSPPDRRARSSLLGFGLASATAIGLSTAGLLAGPSLLPVGGALLESIASAVVGAGIGSLFAGRALELS